jgi:hypothetical protein
VRDPKFLAATKVRGDFGAVNDVLARQARDVRTRPADVFAVDDCDFLSFTGKSLRRDARARATAENHQIKFFRLRFFH